MLSRVQRTIREHGLVARGDLVLCAVSGGPDSMALLHTLWELRDRLGITLEVATVDHGMRAEARAEAAQVAERARDLGLPWHLLTVDVRAARAARAGERKRERASASALMAGDPDPGGPSSVSSSAWSSWLASSSLSSSSWQDVARRLRLAALDQLAQRLGAARIALGHQADDQAETVLFRILRGTGLRGLAGIPYARDRLIRPLMDVERGAILAYLRRRSIPFIEDPSNADRRFARARLRHQIMPELRAENPRLGEALRGLAAEAARLAIPAVGGDAAGLNRRAATVIDRLRATGGGTRRIDVAGAQVEIAYGRVAWLPARRRAKQPTGPTGRVCSRDGGDDHPEGEVTVSGPGDYGWSGAPPVAVRDGAPLVGAAIFDADLVAPPLRLRAMRPGDRMRPRGGRGTRKLSDLLIDAKIARAARRWLPVLTTVDDQIIFVPGLRPAELGRPGPTTRRWLSVFSPPARTELNRDDPETSV